MLKHWRIELTAPDHFRLRPFDGQAPGSERGKHAIRYGYGDIPDAEAIDLCHKTARSIFPEATVVAIYQTTLCDDEGDTRRKVWPVGPTIKADPTTLTLLKKAGF